MVVYLPAPSLILGGCVFLHHDVTLCRKLYFVRVIEHDEVVEAKHASQTTDTLRDFLLYATVRDVSVNLVLHRSLAEASLKELLCYGSTGGEGMTPDRADLTSSRCHERCRVRDGPVWATPTDGTPSARRE